MPTALQAAQAALDSGQMTPAEYALAVKQINDATQSGLPVTAPAPAAAPTAPAPTQGAPAPPGIDPALHAQLSPGAQQVVAARAAQKGGYIMQGLSAIGNAASSAWDANKSLGNAILNPGETNRKLGQAVLDWGKPGDPPAPPGPAQGTVDTGTGASGPAGVTAPQSADDPAAGLLRPGVAGPGRRVGYSEADLARNESLRNESEAAQQNSTRQADAVTKIADGFTSQNQAIADDTKLGLAKYNEKIADNAARAKQLDADTRAANQRIQTKMADLEAQGIDPNRYFQNQTTGQNILGALAVGFGALGAHALGPNGRNSANTALEIMNGAIARDVDAQKTNMQKQLSVLGKRMDLNASGFDQQKALLEAERESIQTAYAVAVHATEKQAAMYKDNVDVQMTKQKIITGLTDKAAELTGQNNAQIYGIQKNAERVVAAPGEDIAKKIQDLTTKYRAQADAAGENPTSAQLHEKVLGDLFGVAGGAPSVDISKPQKGPKTEHDQKAEDESRSLDATEKNIDDLIAMRAKYSKDILGAGTLNPNETGSAKALSLVARSNFERGLGARTSPGLLKMFTDVVPDDPLQIHTLGAFGSDPTMARLKQAKEMIRAQRGGAAPAAAPVPAGFTPRSSP